MHERTTPHEPTITSHEYPAGGRSVRLIPYDPLDRGLTSRMRERLERLIESPQPGEVDWCTGAALAFGLWDDPAISWDVNADPDDMLEGTLSDAEIVRVAQACRRELMAPRAARLGIDPMALLTSTLRAAVGLEPQEAAGTTPGESAPAGESVQPSRSGDDDGSVPA